MWFGTRLGNGGFISMPVIAWIILMPLIVGAIITYYTCYALVIGAMATYQILHARYERRHHREIPQWPQT